MDKARRALQISILLIATVFFASTAYATCSVSNCKWSTNGPVTEGTSVTMSATFSGCSGSVSYKIYEDDAWPLADDYMDTKTVSSPTSKSWTTVWTEDAYNFATNDYDPEYYFELYVGSSYKCSSSDLKVVKKVCTPSEKYCDGGILYTCNSAGSGWTSKSCSPYNCASSMTACQICSPNSKRCNGDYIETCNSAGTGWDGSSCNYGCSSGACKPKPMICIPSTYSCDGDVRKKCSSDGYSLSTVETCTYGCDSSTAKCKAQPKICTPYEKKCSGSTLQTCSSDGYSWDGSSCNYGCSSGACNSPPPCTASNCRWSASGSVEESTSVNMLADFSGECSGKTINFDIYENDVSSPDDYTDSKSVTYGNTASWATSWTQDCILGLCGNPEYYFILSIGGTNQCTSADLGVSKKQMICTPNSKICEGDVLKTCASDGYSWATNTCPNGCDSSTSTCKKLCTPDSKQCDGDTLKICDSQGNSWSSSQSCRYGCNAATLACTPPPVCVANEKRCIVSSVEQCNSQGSAWSAIEPCLFGCDGTTATCNTHPADIVLGDAATILGANSACPPQGTVTASSDCLRALEIKRSASEAANTRLWNKIESYGETTLKVAGYIWIISGLGCVVGYVATATIIACPETFGATCAVGAGGMALTSISCGVFLGDTGLIGMGTSMASSAFRTSKLTELIGTVESEELANGASIVQKDVTENLADIRYAKNGIEREKAIAWETTTNPALYKTSAIARFSGGDQFLQLFDEGVDAFGLSSRYTKRPPIVNFPDVIEGGTALGSSKVMPVADGSFQSELKFALNSYMADNHNTLLMDSTLFHELPHNKIDLFRAENAIAQSDAFIVGDEIFSNTVSAELRTLDAARKAEFIDGRNLKLLTDIGENTVEWVTRAKGEDVGMVYVSARRLGLQPIVDKIESAAQAAYGASDPTVVERLRAYADSWASDISIMTRDISAENPTPEILTILKKNYVPWSFQPPATTTIPPVVPLYPPSVETQQPSQPPTEQTVTTTQPPAKVCTTEKVCTTVKQCHTKRYGFLNLKKKKVCNNVQVCTPKTTCT